MLLRFICHNLRLIYICPLNILKSSPLLPGQAVPRAGLALYHLAYALHAMRQANELSASLPSRLAIVTD